MIKKCPDCDFELIEVRKALIPTTKKVSLMYPKDICKPNIKRIFHEYRFACVRCRKEWIYNSLLRWFEEIPIDADFYYSYEKRILLPSESLIKRLSKCACHGGDGVE